MDPKKSDLNIPAAADALMAQANEAAAVFTQYDQDQVDRIVAAAAKGRRRPSPGTGPHGGGRNRHGHIRGQGH